MEKGQTEILKTVLEGFVRLEVNKELGYMVTIRVDNGKYFYCDFFRLMEIMEDFKLIVDIKHGKPTARRRSNKAK